MRTWLGHEDGCPPLPTPTVEPPMRVHTFTFDYIHSAVFHNRDMKQNCLESRLREHRIGVRERKRRTTQEENHGQLATAAAHARDHPHRSDVQRRPRETRMGWAVRADRGTIKRRTDSAGIDGNGLMDGTPPAL